MNQKPLTDPERLALASALGNRTNFERHSDPEDFKNLINACDKLGIDAEDTEEQFKLTYPDSYADFIGSQANDIINRQAKRELKYRLDRLKKHKDAKAAMDGSMPYSTDDIMGMIDNITNSYRAGMGLTNQSK